MSTACPRRYTQPLRFRKNAYYGYHNTAKQSITQSTRNRSFERWLREPTRCVRQFCSPTRRRAFLARNTSCGLTVAVPVF